MRLIDADALLQTLSDLCSDANNVKTRRTVDMVLHDLMPQIINDEPTIDAQPMKHDHWRLSEAGELYCPFCMFVSTWGDENYCGNCGARMEATP